MRYPIWGHGPLTSRMILSWAKAIQWLFYAIVLRSRIALELIREVMRPR